MWTASSQIVRIVRIASRLEELRETLQPISVRVSNYVFTQESTMAAIRIIYTPDGEDELVDLWRDSPVLYATTEKGYDYRIRKHEELIRLAGHFDITGE